MSAEKKKGEWAGVKDGKDLAFLIILTCVPLGLAPSIVEISALCPKSRGRVQREAAEVRNPKFLEIGAKTHFLRPPRLKREVFKRFPMPL